MQFRRQGTKVLIKLELRKIHLYFAVIIHSTFVNLSKDDSCVFKYRSAAYDICEWTKAIYHCLKISVEITLWLGLLHRSGSFKVTEFGTNRKLIWDLLLMINTNLASILHRFRDIALDRSIAEYTRYIWLQCLTPPTEGFPLMISAKFYLYVSRWPAYQMT